MDTRDTENDGKTGLEYIGVTGYLVNQSRNKIVALTYNWTTEIEN